MLVVIGIPSSEMTSPAAAVGGHAFGGDHLVVNGYGISTMRAKAQRIPDIFL